MPNYRVAALSVVRPGRVVCISSVGGYETKREAFDVARRARRLGRRGVTVYETDAAPFRPTPQPSHGWPW